jgi:hypothetical protein
VSGMYRANGSRIFLLPFIEGAKRSMSILVVGGESAEMFRQRTGGRHGYVAHWSGRKNRDMTKSIPKDTEAVVVVLDRVSHGLAQKVRTEATRRGLPVFFQKRARHSGPTDHDPLDLAQWLSKTSAT